MERMTKGIEASIRTLGIGALAAAALVLPVDARQIHPWQAFLGCWTPAEAVAGDATLCFRRAGEGVEVSSVVAGQVESVELLVADGQPRTLSSGGCEGSRSVEFSSDGRRVFTRSEIACAGDARSSSGVMTFVAPDRWADVRSIELLGEPATWIQEYRPVDEDWFLDHAIEDPSAADRQTVQAMRARASRPIGTAEVEEATSHIAVGASEMWVAVQPSAFDLDGGEILGLADRGLPASVIDVMVAVSYPDRFVLSLDGSTPVAEARPDSVPGSTGSGRMVPYFRGRSFLFDPFFGQGIYRYGRYGAFGFSTAGSYFWPGRSFRYSGWVPATIVVEPRPPASQGRMVNGQGYRRTSPTRSATGSGGNRGSSSGPVSSGGASAPVESRSPVTTSGSNGSSGGSPPPGANPSSRTPTGRTARPRN